ncbi:MAG: ABC transporter permease subunit [Methylobacteriaceae bacterium]|nr:ABC transporter permease subunit [Methylobacteriaceae bacterium]
MFVRFAPALTIAALIGPIAAGVIGTLLPAFGYFPALAGRHFSLAPWHALFASPGLARSVLITAFVGTATTAVSLTLVMAIFAAFDGTRQFRIIRRFVSPLLAMPHAALAIGLAFLIAPSGWLVRIAAWAGAPIERPPDLLIVHDRLGLSLMAALIIKEMAFLFLMVLAALPQSDGSRALTLARTLGYHPAVAWMKAVLPRVYPQIRLPVLAVLSYSLSVVDVALILGPTTPPPLPVLVLHWMNDPDLRRRFLAAAAALLQLGLVVGAGLVWIALERNIINLARPWLIDGQRSGPEYATKVVAGAAVIVTAGAVLMLTTALTLWSVAESWRFPEVLPPTLTLTNWQSQIGAAPTPLVASLGIGALASGLALVLTVGCLEHEVRFGRRVTQRALWLLYAPLLVPQVAFLFGFDVVLAAIGIDGGFGEVLAAHLLFVLPYVFLSLGDPWRAFDERYRWTALCLGASPNRVLFRVRLPMLLRPLLTAAAVGFAISVGQYLPTLVAGGGRIATLTTEAVGLSAGGDRRIVAVYAILQMLLPALGFALAVALPSIAFRDRRGMSTGA